MPSNQLLLLLFTFGWLSQLLCCCRWIQQSFSSHNHRNFLLCLATPQNTLPIIWQIVVLGAPHFILAGTVLSNTSWCFKRTLLLLSCLINPKIIPIPLTGSELLKRIMDAWKLIFVAEMNYKYSFHFSIIQRTKRKQSHQRSTFRQCTMVVGDGINLLPKTLHWGTT